MGKHEILFGDAIELHHSYTKYIGVLFGFYHVNN
jgi:hypothetical protein